MATKQPDVPASKTVAQPTTASAADKQRKTWKPKTRQQIVLEQAEKIREEVIELEEQLKAKRRELEKFEEIKKIFESA